MSEFSQSFSYNKVNEFNTRVRPIPCRRLIPDTRHYWAAARPITIPIPEMTSSTAWGICTLLHTLRVPYVRFKT